MVEIMTLGLSVTPHWDKSLNMHFLSPTELPSQAEPVTNERDRHGLRRLKLHLEQ